MSRMLSLSVLILASVSLIGCGKSGDETEPMEKKIIGKWKINVDRSVELSKTNPKISDEYHERLPKMIEGIADKLEMEITASEIIAGAGTRTKSMAYKVDSTDADAKTVTLSLTDKEGVTLVCKIIDGTYLNIVSSDTDDMNYYVFEPVKETPAE